MWRKSSRHVSNDGTTSHGVFDHRVLPHLGCVDSNLRSDLFCAHGVFDHRVLPHLGCVDSTRPGEAIHGDRR